MADHDDVLTQRLHHPASAQLRAALRPAEVERQPEEGGLLVSPGFWIAGLVSLLIWLSVAAYFGLL